ncbi:MAG: hypothetical protein A2271_00640 [Candidatus Moranbacteria bacterium RIFOXYA12_FULL_35_19]|nr:MAG: hypothetical protein UR78_C0015G0018 [Candidatus Moranbacteria bacterium GW2011_GWF2_35_39]OGI32266.1 MAG: hypothetical protein A2489_02920 [Candidatus Moranbacteria bacterium RIFOXYC12_FULL_36_13]OGI32351.1 MAG: hypothetical protein A2343_04330 [Candidatus Moranbacteria bacterium RIFOXYB12_FULL_35_8]OGI35871.1 MAG: hypothetical protein A2271_00640 [Candidatus Moranbacteria bacterium RIFOXYA12_FULL_35_19]
MKKFLIITILAILIILTGLFFVFDANKNKIMASPYMKLITHKITNFIYDEATKHNPQSDILPDKIDDEIKKDIKEIVN